MPAPAGSSLNDTALRRCNEREQLFHLRAPLHFRMNALDRLGRVQSRARQQPEGGLQRFDRLLRKAAPLQTHAVGAEHLHFRLVARQRVGHHILLDHAIRSDESVLADAAELMDAAEGSHIRPVVDDDVACQPDAVPEDHVIPDHAIVRDVRVSHEQIVIADLGQQSPALCTAMYGHKFADAVAAADARLGPFPSILHILGSNPNRRKREENIVFADGARAFDEEIRHQARAGADLDFRADDAVWPDIRRLMNPRRRIDDRCRMNRHYSAAGGSAGALSCSLHITSASATTLPSTVAFPAILATEPFCLMTTI